MIKEVSDYAERLGPDYTGAEIEFASDIEVAAKQSQARGPFTLTEWAKSQIYGFYGVRHHWFSFVTSTIAAEELNRRLATTPDRRFRTVRLGDSWGELDYIRGFVSKSYAEISDVEVLAALVSLFPDPEDAIVLGGSTKSEQSLYAAVANRETYSMPTATGPVCLGVLIRNSEVGATALVAEPVMYLIDENQFVPIPKGTLYRRTHRGNIQNIREGLDDALKANRLYVSNFDAMVLHLDGILYPDKETAAEHCYQAVVRGKGTKSFAEACKKQYLGVERGHHSAMTLVRVIATTALMVAPGIDAYFSLSSVAGAVAANLADIKA